jgi:hypothetical protein
MPQTPSQKLTLPGVGRGGFAFDPSAVRDALDLLGITHRVNIKIVGLKAGRSYSRGNRRARFANGEPTSYWHEIHVDTDLDYRQASEVLWHELQHAAQDERFGDDPYVFAREYAAETAREGGGYSGYFNNGYEVEARATATTMADVLLTRPATR